MAETLKSGRVEGSENNLYEHETDASKVVGSHLRYKSGEVAFRTFLECSKDTIILASLVNMGLIHESIWVPIFIYLVSKILTATLIFITVRNSFTDGMEQVLRSRHEKSLIDILYFLIPFIGTYPRDKKPKEQL